LDWLFKVNLVFGSYKKKRIMKVEMERKLNYEGDGKKQEPVSHTGS